MDGQVIAHQAISPFVDLLRDRLARLKQLDHISWLRDIQAVEDSAIIEESEMAIVFDLYINKTQLKL